MEQICPICMERIELNEFIVTQTTERTYTGVIGNPVHLECALGSMLGELTVEGE